MSDSSIFFPLVNRLDPAAIMARGRAVVRQEAEALGALGQALDESFVAACGVMARCRRRVVVSGMGKSGHIGRKMAATLSATGTPAVFLHPAEAAHGDLGMMTRGDVLLVISNSGHTQELRAVVAHGAMLGIAIIAMVSEAASWLGERADVVLVLPRVAEVCASSMAPTTSTIVQLALGDALALAVMEARGVSPTSLHRLHPGGAIGMRLRPVGEVMHRAEAMPLVSAEAAMGEVISVMTRGRFGLAGVVDAQGSLLGIITDGDVRRHFAVLGTARAEEVMTRSPRSVSAGMLAVEVLQFLNEAKITAAFVMGEDGRRPLGIIHIHDLLQMGAGQ